MEIEGDNKQTDLQHPSLVENLDINTTHAESQEHTELTTKDGLFKKATKYKKIVSIVAIIIILMLLSSVGGYLFIQRNRSSADSMTQPSKNQGVQNTTPTIVVSASPTPATKVNPVEQKSVDTLNVNATIKIPFVRDGNIYLYEDGQEKLIAKPSQETTNNACFHLVYPLISPNGKYIAYIEQVGDSPGYGGCTMGTLRIVDVTSSIVRVTEYQTSLFNIYSWNNQNQLLLEATLPDNKVKFAIYDPSSKTELVSETVDYMQRDAGYRGYPLYSSQKVVKYKDSKYYLVNPNTGTETLLVEGDDINDFRGWSPDGKYALFGTSRTAPEQETAFSGIWLAVNTDSLSEPTKEVLVLFGAAGGEFSTGNKWYFNEAFVGYCSQHLVFLDGSEPIELTNSGGGGCHNQEGFVATSPNGNYAFVKYADRFELHTAGGQTQVVNETEKLSKGRGFPKNLIWLNNDTMIMFERVYSGDNYGDQELSKIHIYDRVSNTLKPLISNAYLIESPN